MDVHQLERQRVDVSAGRDFSRCNHLVFFFVLKFDFQVLHNHVDCIRVFSDKGDNDVTVLHRRLNEIVVGWFDKATVL